MDDIMLTPAEEAYWEWSQKSMSLNSLAVLYIFGPFLAPIRFAVKQWKMGLLIVGLGIVSLILASNISTFFSVPIILLYFYEWATRKPRIVKYNTDLRRELEKKWGTRLPLSRAEQLLYGLKWE